MTHDDEVLFPTFLEDEAVYAAVEDFWLDRYRPLLLSAGGWVSRIQPRINDGTPLLAGNPIFSAISPDDRRAFNIIQESADPDDGLFGGWVTTVDPEVRKVRALTVYLVLQERTVRLVDEVLEAWVAKKATMADTRKLLRSLAHRVE